MLQLGLADECCKAMHVPLAMQNVLSAYNMSSQLVVSSIKGMFIESRISRKVTQVSLVSSSGLTVAIEIQGSSAIHH